MYHGVFLVQWLELTFYNRRNNLIYLVEPTPSA
jgi:hypothetical protein